MNSTSSVHKTPALLEVRQLGHSFGGLSVLTHLNFDVVQGQIAGLIGPNGSGKSTCFNIVSGFLPPRKGTVRFDGQDVTRLSVQAHSRMGLVRTFQTPQVFAHMSVLENLMTGSYKNTACGAFADMLRLPHARRDLNTLRERALAAADKFGLTPLLKRRAGDLPAGQMRVVELARACIGEPRLLLLDEPSSGLNSSEIALLRDWIVQLNQEGLSILLVSHDMGLMTVAHDVHVLYFGEIIARGPMATIESDARVREAYLGV
jgi:ABC-type branched-subunit amino acid transport system ATPase component